MQHDASKLRQSIVMAATKLRQGDLKGAGNSFEPVLDQLCWDNEVRSHSSFQQLWVTVDQPIKVLQYKGFAETSISSCYSAGWHSVKRSGRYEKTMLGNWLYNLKPYRRSSLVVDEIARTGSEVLLTLLCQAVPKLCECDLVAATPSSPRFGTAPSSLFANAIARTCEIKAAPEVSLTKTRLTSPMKDLRTLEAKRQSIFNSMEADRSVYSGRRVLLLDDILDSGFTVREAARALRQAGALEIHVLTLTKTHDFVGVTLEGSR